jgi:hypothetical protein
MISPDLGALVVRVLEELGLEICKRVRADLEALPTESLAEIAEETDGDTIYQIDRNVDPVIFSFLRQHLEPHTSFVLVAEGCAETGRVFPEETPHEGAELRVVLDPIDGTRGIMYDKRSAWFLAGVAENRGHETRLEDVELAVQVEIPTTRSDLADVLSARRGQGVTARTVNLRTGDAERFAPQPSRARTVRGGFAMLARMFPPGRDVLAAIDDELMTRVLGEARGRTVVFEDQFPCTGSQLYNLAVGKDRFVADLRPLVYAARRARGEGDGMTCHPYDVSTFLIAREAGVIVRSFPRPEFDCPLDAITAVAWAGYANEAIQSEIEPTLMSILEKQGLLEAIVPRFGEQK